MLADCDRCALRDIACAQCVITALPDGQAGLGDEERRALRALAAAGLVPPLRFRPVQAATAQGTAAEAAAAQAATAPGAQALELTAAPACSTAPSAPVTGARPGPRRPGRAALRRPPRAPAHVVTPVTPVSSHR